MASASAAARIILALCFFFLPLSILRHHVAAATSPPVSFSLDFSNNSTALQDDIRLEGDASLSRGLVDLTCNSETAVFCSGRMSYNHPVPFYNNVTGEVASFSTTFTFGIIMWPDTNNRGDGMTFFLTGYPSSLLPGSASSVIGLTNSSKYIPSGGDRYVAVEFDTYSNPWDPAGSSDHIGININNITSDSATLFPRYSLNGTMTATVTFDGATRILEATLHFDANRSLDASVKTQLPDQLDALLPPMVAVGFSAGTGAYSELHQIYSWTFNSTMEAKGATNKDPNQGQVLGTEETSPGATNFHPKQVKVHNTKGQRRRGLIIGGSVVLPSGLLLSIWSILSWYKWTGTRDSFGKGSRLKRYEYRDLSIDTDTFSDKKEIGRGGFDGVYTGRLKDKQVAVKRIHEDSRGEFKDFLAELGAIDETGHVNLVRLEGWCCSINNFLFWCLHRNIVNLFLFYEFVPNGNLHQHLHEKPEVLSWERRYKIVKGLWSALHYLHHECSQYTLHRDIKPSNILLDNDFNAKLGYFSLSRVVQDNAETLLGLLPVAHESPLALLQTAISVGTPDYLNPLSKENGKVKLRRSSDVYSFGIVLLEIAHGQNDPEGVRKLHKDQPQTFVKAVADKKLAGKFVMKEMERIIVLGLRCSERDENKRPSLIGAMKFLEHGGELPPATVHEDEPHTAS